MSGTSPNTLYLVEGVNQVGNVFTDTLKLMGEKRDSSEVTLRELRGPDKGNYGALFH